MIAQAKSWAPTMRFLASCPLLNSRALRKRAISGGAEQVFG